jgi:hypothetical protein
MRDFHGERGDKGVYRYQTYDLMRRRERSLEIPNL